MNNLNITNYIIETVLKHPFILGSQLGSKVKQTFPSFEGLKSYIDRHCAGEIICVSKHGPDFIYAHVSQIERKSEPDNSTRNVFTPQPAFAPSPIKTDLISSKNFTSQLSDFSPNNIPMGQKIDFVRAPIPLARNVTVWSAFTNPGVEDRLGVDTSTMTLQIVSPDRSIQSPILEIPKVTTEEHHNIASTFLPQMEFQDRQNFQQSPGVAIAWSSWSWHIKQFAGGKYFGLWLDFRTKSLYKLLEERLVKLGFDRTASEPLLNKLLESKQQRTPRPETIADFGGNPLSRNQTSMTENELRRLATIAISEMSADELRRLCFPLGAIVNALPRNAS